MNVYVSVIDKVLGLVAPLFKPSAILARQRRKAIYRADKFFRIYAKWLNTPKTNHKQDMLLQSKMLVYYHAFLNERNKLA